MLGLAACAGEAQVSDAGPRCTSDAGWTEGERGSARMLPGRPCVSCHAARDAATFSLGGTVYPTARERDDCNGVDGAQGERVTVEVTDALGQRVTMTANTVGNFYHRLPLSLPYTVVVRRGDRVRAMRASQRDGDCNACHTEGGANGAPGRITAP